MILTESAFHHTENSLNCFEILFIARKRTAIINEHHDSVLELLLVVGSCFILSCFILPANFRTRMAEVAFAIKAVTTLMVSLKRAHQQMPDASKCSQSLFSECFCSRS